MLFGFGVGSFGVGCDLRLGFVGGLGEGVRFVNGLVKRIAEWCGWRGSYRGCAGGSDFELVQDFVGGDFADFAGLDAQGLHVDEFAE